jgi:hypothetical protein
MKALAGKRKRLTTMAVIIPLWHSESLQVNFTAISCQYGNTAYDPDRNCPKSEPKSVIEIGQKGPDKYCEFFFRIWHFQGEYLQFSFFPYPLSFCFCFVLNLRNVRQVNQLLRRMGRYTASQLNTWWGCIGHGRMVQVAGLV